MTEQSPQPDEQPTDIEEITLVDAPPDRVPPETRPDTEGRRALRSLHGHTVHLDVPEYSTDIEGHPHSIGIRRYTGRLHSSALGGDDDNR